MRNRNNLPAAIALFVIPLLYIAFHAH